MKITEALRVAAERVRLIPLARAYPKDWRQVVRDELKADKLTKEPTP